MSTTRGRARVRARPVAAVPAAVPRRRIRLDTDERRAQLLALAKHAFAERTYDEVSIDDIARAAAISKGLLYHYFPTKRDLYVAGLREIAAELVAKTEAVPQDLAPIDRVRAGIDAYLDHVAAQAGGYIALMRGGIGSDHEVVGVLEDTRQRLIDQIVDKAAGSPLAPAVGQPIFKRALRGWIGFVEAATLDYLAAGDRDRTALRDLLVDMLLAALRAVGDSESRSWLARKPS
jgi:AcrR family transcriptional regulator